MLPPEPRGNYPFDFTTYILLLAMLIFGHCKPKHLSYNQFSFIRINYTVKRNEEKSHHRLSDRYISSKYYHGR